jgi:hypothetical protein
MKQVSHMRELAIRTAIDQVNPHYNDSMNAELVIGIHELLGLPLRIEIPMHSFHARYLVSQTSKAISEAQRIKGVLASAHTPVALQSKKLAKVMA